MAVSILEADLRAIEKIFEAKKIPNLECECEDEELGLSLNLYQLEEE